MPRSTQQPKHESNSDHAFVRVPLTFGSLFAGIGGLDLGFERAGMECKWQVEIDEYARRVLAKHWPKVRRHDDVRTWPDENAESVDCIVGGFPCQDISYAGKGAGIQGERSGLFFEAMRIVREMEPRFVVLENVSALLTRGMGDVLGTLSSIGYDAEWHCLQAADFGAPHLRDRVFIIANSNAKMQHGANENATTHERLRVDSDVSNALRIEQQQGARRRRIRESDSELANATGERFEQAEQQVRRRTKNGRPSCTDRQRRQFCRGVEGCWSTEPAVGRVANGIPNRVDRLRGLGNAVVPQVAEYIGRCIVASEKNVA